MKKMALLFALMILPGCSTIKYGSKQDVPITTNPPGLKASINLKQCLTPCVIKDVSRNQAEFAVIEYGGQKHQYVLEKTINWWTVTLGNIWNDIWIGALVDRLTGAAFNIEPVNIDFNPPSEKAVSLENNKS